MSQGRQDVRHKCRMRCVAIFLLLVPALASAQAYPVRPIRLIAPSSPGSGIDIVSRIVAQKLSEQMGQQVVVDNRAGAAGNLGAELAAKAPADGYTLFMSSPAHAINTGLYHKLNYDLVRDFAPVSLLTIGHYCVVVHPSLPVQSVKELIALARARRGQLNYASAGAGNSNHLAGALFLKMAHIEMVHVPYKGSGPALTDLVGGQVQVMFSNLTPALPYVRTKRLRALAVSGEKRSAIMPELPTVREAGVPGYRVVTWFGLMTPAGVSPEIVARLQRESMTVMRSPDVRDKLAGEGAEPIGGTSEQFAAFIASEITQWVNVIRDVGVSVE